jgi:branched-chain amino acid transport system ATP-binding protein
VSDAPRFECRDIEAGYGEVCIIPSFDLTANSGDVVAILGPNGAGKTTLLNTLAGLLPTQEGTIEVNGVRIKKGRPAEASAAGLVLVPDDRALFTTLTVDENLRAAHRRHATTTVDDVIDLFPALGLRRKLTVGNLSGGEQQMLAMARALMQEPQVLLIDEMSMGLAPVIVESLLGMVRTIANERQAVVMLVEQHVGLALEVADRAIVLVHGEVSLDESAAALKGDVARLEAAYFGGHAATNGSTTA